MKVVEYASYVSTMIGPEGHAHRWMAPRKNHSAHSKINASTKAWLRDCATLIYALSVLGCVGSISAPDEATLKAEAHALQFTTAGPYNAISTNLLLCWFRVWPWTRLGWALSASRPAIELPPVRPHSAKALRRFRQLVGMYYSNFRSQLRLGKEISGHFHGS